MKTIGIFGGSFNPIHIGHVALARRSLAAFGLDLLVVMPSGTHPFKGDTGRVTARDRYMMTRLAFAEDIPIMVSDLEVRAGGVSYSIATVERLAGFFKGDRLIFVQGSDILDELDRWHRAEDFGKYCSFGIASRKGAAPANAEDRVRELSERLQLHIEYAEIDVPEVSSTELRERLAAGKDCGGLIPGPVMDYIRERGLYGCGI